MYTQEQLKRREKSVCTKLMSTLAPLQFVAFVVSFYLVIRFLITGEGYLGATISIWIKIGLLWAMTVTGMLWEKEMYGHYFMCKEFFWEDLGNLIAMLSHNAYFVVKWIGWGQKEIMLVMCFAYITYLFNFGQFAVRWAKSRCQRQQTGNT